MADYFSPEVDVFEGEDFITIYINLPGVKRDDISVELLGRELILRGIKKSMDYESAQIVHRIERNYGKLYSQILLPTAVDEKNISAELEDGVLKIRLKKKKMKKIKID